jgi:hypothetical protein
MISTQSPVSLAVSRAIAESELRRMEMMRGMDEPRAVSLLIKQADDAASSPLAYDQLLALALRAAAGSGEPDHRVLDALRAPADALARQEVARAVFAQYSEAPFRAVLKAAPDWELRRGLRRVGREPLSLAGWLRSAGALARSLWDHPDLPVGPSRRGAMLATARALEQRAGAFAFDPATAVWRPRTPGQVEEIRA